MSKIDQMSQAELEEFALALIGIVDYDIEKECDNSIAEDGYDLTVDEIIAKLISEFGD